MHVPPGLEVRLVASGTAEPPTEAGTMRKNTLTA